VGLEDDVVAQDGPGVDDAVCADVDVLPDLRTGVDDGELADEGMLGYRDLDDGGAGDAVLIDYLFLLAYTTRREAMIATVRTTARIHSPEPRSQSFPPPWASGMSLSSTKNWCAFVSLA